MTTLILEPEFYFKEEEFNLISKIIGKTLIDLHPATLILTAPHHARLYLLCEYGIIQEIFNFEISLNRRLNLITVQCDDTANLVHIVEGFTRWQLKIIYEAMLRRFNFELPEFSIDVLINLQFEKGNRFPYFGKDIFTGLNKNPD